MRLTWIVVVFLLSGCSAFTVPESTAMTGLLLGDVVSLSYTQKTLEDHAASKITGQDCSFLRYIKGYPYCEDIIPPVKVSRDSFCYKTLAAITCYEQPLESDSSRFQGKRRDYIPVHP